MLVIFAPRSAGFVARFGQARVQAFGLTLVAIGLLVTASLTPTSNYAMVALGLVIMGIGMACTTAPATNAIVSSVPLAKSGVGSAVNDTTREVGGALGIAVIGSLVASAYRSTMAGKVAGLPAELAGQARDSVGGAFGGRGRPWARAARSWPPQAKLAFTDAMGTALVVAAVVALVCAGIVLVYFPRTPAPCPEPGPRPRHRRMRALRPALGPALGREPPRGPTPSTRPAPGSPPTIRRREPRRGGRRRGPGARRRRVPRRSLMLHRTVPRSGSVRS